MTGWLLDTDVVSALARPDPPSAVTTFLAGLQTPSHLSVITLHELAFGIALLSDGRRKSGLASWLATLEREFDDLVLPVDRVIAGHAAMLRERTQGTGHALHLADALIAGTALGHRLTLVSRNLRRFAPTGIAVVDPFDHG